MAWFSNWTYGQQLAITVPSGTVATLSYFPVVLTAASLPTELTNNTHGRSDGGDLAFAADLGLGNCPSSIGSQLPCEVVSAAFGGTPSAEIHVQVPSVAATGTLTYIWVLYGNSGQTAQPSASSTYGSQAVWNEHGVQNFAAVWHFGTPATLSLVDSTSASIVLTNNGTATNGTGMFGGAVSLNGTSQYLSSSLIPSFSPPATISVCLKRTDSNLLTYLCDGPNDAPNHYRATIARNIVTGSDGKVDIYAGGAPQQGNSDYTGAWEQIGGVFSGTNSYLYRSGATDIGPVNPGSNGGLHGIVIGERYVDNAGGANHFGGLIEEFRISSVVRSGSWFAAEYANQSAPGTFIAPPSGQGSVLVNPYIFLASGLAISGAYGGSTFPISSPAAGLAISGAYGGTGATLFAPSGGLAISGGPGGNTAGPSPGAAGLAISGGFGGMGATLFAPLGGLAISGGSGGMGATVSVLLAGLGISGSPAGITSCPPAYIFSASGLAISGGSGAVAATVTVLLAGLGISGEPGSATDMAQFYLPYEYTSVVIETGNANPFGIDPEATTTITVGLTGAD